MSIEQNLDPRICMALTSDGLTAYCNKSGLMALSRRLAEIAQSLPDEHYEMHVRLELEDGAAPRDTNIAVLRTKDLAPLVAPHGRSDQQDFELTFMHVPQHELDDLRAYQTDGLLPDSWNSDPQEE